MGLTYKIVNTEKKELDRVTCDRCKADIEKITEGGWNPFGEPFSVYHEPSFKDFFLLDMSWGYHSDKDGESHRAVICEPCYDDIFKGVSIQVTNYM